MSKKFINAKKFAIKSNPKSNFVSIYLFKDDEIVCLNLSMTKFLSLYLKDLNLKTSK